MRYEKKYLLSEQQKQQLCETIGERFVEDSHGKSTISNIYFDTPDMRLVRRSIEKPAYKEKLRLRTYGVPKDGNASVFAEIKKKYSGIVYKRRADMKYSQATDFLYNRVKQKPSTQIIDEIDRMFVTYDGLAPAMFLSYDRTALFNNENPDLRITFDNNITWRNYDLELSKGVYGNKLLSDGFYIMEIKIPGSMPVWLAHALCEQKLYSTSFSKYGTAYSICEIDKPVTA